MQCKYLHRFMMTYEFTFAGFQIVSSLEVLMMTRLGSEGMKKRKSRQTFFFKSVEFLHILGKHGQEIEEPESIILFRPSSM